MSNLNLNLQIAKVPKCCDLLAAVLIVLSIALLVLKNIVVPNEAKLALLLAIIVLISAYNIEIAIMVVLVSIVLVLVQNQIRKQKKNRN
jgi:hypothetical protein